MAAIEIKEQKSGKASFCKKQKRASTRVDLTPMVDLGFLLITFFVFTTSISQPTSLSLNMPKDTDSHHTNVPRSGAMTLLLSGDDMIHYYFGWDTLDVKKTTYSGIRDIILTRKKNTPPEKLFVIIKPGNEATYKNLVDIFDEMKIDDIARYSIADISENESRILRKI